MTEEIDKLLKGYFRREQPMNRLDQLENDVWQRIASIKQEQPVGIMEELLSFLFPAQHRLAPVMAAAVLGIMLGYGTIASPSPSAAEALNLKVFKPQAIMLASIP